MGLAQEQAEEKPLNVFPISGLTQISLQSHSGNSIINTTKGSLSPVVLPQYEEQIRAALLAGLETHLSLSGGPASNKAMEDFRKHSRRILDDLRVAQAHLRARISEIYEMGENSPYGTHYYLPSASSLRYSYWQYDDEIVKRELAKPIPVNGYEISLLEYQALLNSARRIAHDISGTSLRVLFPSAVAPSQLASKNGQVQVLSLTANPISKDIKTSFPLAVTTGKNGNGKLVPAQVKPEIVLRPQVEGNGHDSSLRINLHPDYAHSEVATNGKKKNGRKKELELAPPERKNGKAEPASKPELSETFTSYASLMKQTRGKKPVENESSIRDAFKQEVQKRLAKSQNKSAELALIYSELSAAYQSQQKTLLEKSLAWARKPAVAMTRGGLGAGLFTIGVLSAFGVLSLGGAAAGAMIGAGLALRTVGSYLTVSSSVDFAHASLTGAVDSNADAKWYSKERMAHRVKKTVGFAKDSKLAKKFGIGKAKMDGRDSAFYAAASSIFYGPDSVQVSAGKIEVNGKDDLQLSQLIDHNAMLFSSNQGRVERKKTMAATIAALLPGVYFMGNLMANSAGLKNILTGLFAPKQHLVESIAPAPSQSIPEAAPSISNATPSDIAQQRLPFTDMKGAAAAARLGPLVEGVFDANSVSTITVSVNSGGGFSHMAKGLLEHTAVGFDTLEKKERMQLIISAKNFLLENPELVRINKDEIVDMGSKGLGLVKNADALFTSSSVSLLNRHLATELPELSEKLSAMRQAARVGKAVASAAKIVPQAIKI